MSIVHTPDARVLSMLRSKPKSRYQIQEMLGDSHRTDYTLNRLMEHLYSNDLVIREGVLYHLSKRGQAALQLLDMARNRRLAESSEQPASADGIDAETRRLMKRSPPRGCASNADLAPKPARPGSLKFLEFPSRFGNTLRYRDGRITDMAGNALPTTA